MSTNSAELDGPHVELLPTRTLLSLISMTDLSLDGAPGSPGAPGTGIPGNDMLPIELPIGVGNSGSGGSGSPG